MHYEPEKYWNEVAQRIAARKTNGLVAGDDGPFYRYKRKKFLSLFGNIDFAGKTVLEVGPGPGGNLLVVAAQDPKELHGADVSANMLAVAAKVLVGKDARLKKTKAGILPYGDAFFDISYAVTVLQHNTDEAMLQNLVKEMSRVTTGDLYIFERIESRIKGTPLCLGRPVSHYSSLFKAEGFNLEEVKFLNVQVSHWVCGGLRKLLNLPSRKEGEKESKLSMALQSLALPVTSLLDNVFKPKRDLAMLHFKRT